MNRERLVTLLAAERSKALNQGKRAMAERITASIRYAKGAVAIDQVINSIPMTIYKRIAKEFNK